MSGGGRVKTRGRNAPADGSELKSTNNGQPSRRFVHAYRSLWQSFASLDPARLNWIAFHTDRAEGGKRQEANNDTFPPARTSNKRVCHEHERTPATTIRKD